MSTAMPQGGLPQPGAVIAKKYRIGAVLGAGGMGIVVTAQHLELKQPVAIKFVRATSRSTGRATILSSLAFFARRAPLRVSGASTSSASST